MGGVKIQSLMDLGGSANRTEEVTSYQASGLGICASGWCWFQDPGQLWQIQGEF